jgi:hypothetical protein
MKTERAKHHKKRLNKIVATTLADSCGTLKIDFTRAKKELEKERAE